jgi:thiol:disulfide interchange protein
MKRRKIRRTLGAASRRSFAGAAVIAMLAAGAILAHRAAAQYGGDSSSWPQNAGGYFAASEISKAEGRPMFVYFRTDWCPYCREFEHQLLGSGQVDSYLQGMARVRVNPEAGEREETLAGVYGVEGYPGIYWQRHPSAPPVRVSRTVRGANGEARLKTPAEFIAGLRQAAAGK